jgi:hypothetical protein
MLLRGGDQDHPHGELLERVGNDYFSYFFHRAPEFRASAPHLWRAGDLRDMDRGGQAKDRADTAQASSFGPRAAADPGDPLALWATSSSQSDILR